MRAVAIEGGADGIRANAILPGAIDTPMLEREVAAAGDPRQQFEHFGTIAPLGRMGQPEDIAPAAVFLATDDARFITGTCLAADGGLLAALNNGPALSYLD
jgi:NAD(P)-dependent dehydrogenase (short-subunit alcohol dehydrogenase family)